MIKFIFAYILIVLLVFISMNVRRNKFYKNYLKRKKRGF